MRRTIYAACERDALHVPVDPAHPRFDELYRKPVAGLLIAKLVPERITAKHKLGQNLKPADFDVVMTGLWRRGRRGIGRVIELCRAAHPARPLPSFLRPTTGELLEQAGVELCCAVGAGGDDRARLCELLRDQYWCEGADDGALVESHEGASAWVGAREADGTLVASARALADGRRHAMIHDLIVAPKLRGLGIGAAVLDLLLDHPRVRGCARIELVTRDAQRLYARRGFLKVEGGGRYERMRLSRGGRFRL